MPRGNRPQHELDQMLLAVLLLVVAGPAVAAGVGFVVTFGRRLGLW